MASGIEATNSSTSGAVSGGIDYSFSGNDYQQEPEWKKNLTKYGVFGAAEKYSNLNPNIVGSGASIW